MRIQLNRFALAVPRMLVAAALVVPAAGCAPTRSETSARAAAAAVATETTSAAAVEETAAVVVDSRLADDLAYLRDEEKLALDLYNALASKWDSAVFRNIARSEQRHVDEVLALMKKYGVEDPSADKGDGEFANENLQTLYDDLLATGSASLAGALKAGKAVEETDIADLDERIARTIETDVLDAFKHLRSGSLTHLTAFEKQLDDASTGTKPITADQASGGANGQGKRDGSGGGQGKGQGKHDGSGRE